MVTQGFTLAKLAILGNCESRNAGTWNGMMNGMWNGMQNGSNVVSTQEVIQN